MIIIIRVQNPAILSLFASTDNSTNLERRKREFSGMEHSTDAGQMIYGIRPVMEALDAGKEFEKIYIGRTARGELILELKNALKEKQIEWQDVPPEKLDRFTRKNHQEVVAFISPVSYVDIAQIIPTLFEQGITPLILVLDRITDVRNFGAIARTAECAGVQAIVIPSKHAAQVTPDAIRTSAGALTRIPVCRVNQLRDVLTYLHDSGIRIFAASEKGNAPHYAADFNSPAAIIMGSEEDGISQALLQMCDQQLRIPLHGQISSLNVSVACGVLLFEVVRQRKSN